MAERLQKVLARAGFGSRRQIETWIRDGKITVNGKLAELGVTVADTDLVKIEGRSVSIAADPTRTARTLIYHKPAGELTTRKDEAGRPTVFDNLPRIKNGRWITVGRLDFNTSGLLLVTTDGELAHRLMHPSWEIEREYAVRILGKVDEESLKRLQDGVMLEDGMAAFASIQDAGGAGANHWYHVIVREGKNREVRRLWESQGLQVSRLIRIRYGPIELPRSVRAGHFQDLQQDEVKALYATVKLDAPAPHVMRRPGKKRRRPR
ncbi:MAG TPA: 23S rRNA pseudouridylate synthase B [Gammaproteobacteria bacterium]|nr:23S rRNA pseudouridylate synthase B [Gammaproteobacteria bacterium]